MRFFYVECKQKRVFPFSMISLRSSPSTNCLVAISFLPHYSEELLHFVINRGWHIKGLSVILTAPHQPSDFILWHAHEHCRKVLMNIKDKTEYNPINYSVVWETDDSADASKLPYLWVRAILYMSYYVVFD